MTTVWVTFVISLLVAILATRMMIAVAWRLKFLDRPDRFRKTHPRAVPRLGGPAVYAAFAAPLLAMLVFRDLTTVSNLLLERTAQLWALLACSTLALILGFFDDLRDLRARWKLLFQVLIAYLAWLFGYRIQVVSNPFGGALELGIFALPVTIFWFIGCMNAVNLLDGLDGLAAGMCLFVSITLFLVSIQFQNVIAMVLMACVAGSLLGFLFFNFPPARIFLGNSGSMFLGFLVAALSLIGASRKAEVAVALFVPIVALGLPIFDTALAVVRRWYKRLPISLPDRSHIHHLLVTMGYSQRRVVLILYGICVLLGGSAMLLMVRRNEIVILVIGSLILVGFASARIFSGVRATDLITRLAGDRRRQKQIANGGMLVADASVALRSAGNVNDVWQACLPVFEGMDYAWATLALDADCPGLITELSWRRTGPLPRPAKGKDADSWQVDLVLRLSQRVVGHLKLGAEAEQGVIMPELSDFHNELRNVIEKAFLSIHRAAASGAGRK